MCREVEFSRLINVWLLYIYLVLHSFLMIDNYLFCSCLIRLQAQESMLAQSQICVQELTSELRNRCLELRELSQRIQDDDKLFQVRLFFSPLVVRRWCNILILS